METVYISTGICAGMIYGYVCGEQMLKYIRRDGCTMGTIINSVGTLFMPIIVPLVFAISGTIQFVRRIIYGREDEGSQIIKRDFKASK